MSSQMINVGGHFLSKEAGHINFIGLHPGGRAPLPPPKPGSKGAGAKGAGSAGDAGTLGGSDHEKAGKAEGASGLSPLKGWSQTFGFFKHVSFLISRNYSNIQAQNITLRFA